MHKIDTPSAVNGSFVDKNVSAGVPGTVCDAKWLNSVQNEICNTIEAAGMTLDRQDDSQLNVAIKKIADESIDRRVVSSTSKSAINEDWCKIGDNFHVDPGDVVDITVECRYDIGDNHWTVKDFRLKLPSSSYQFLYDQTGIRGSGYFSARCVYKYDGDNYTAGNAYFECFFTGDLSQYSFSINGTVSKS